MNPTKTSTMYHANQNRNAPQLQNWLFSSSFYPIILSSASSLAGLVYGYMRRDKVGGTWGSVQYFSRRNSLQLQPQQLLYLLTLFCACIVSEECSRCFMGSREVKSRRRHQVFTAKTCRKRGLLLWYYLDMAIEAAGGVHLGVTAWHLSGRIFLFV